MPKFVYENNLMKEEKNESKCKTNTTKLIIKDCYMNNTLNQYDAM